MSDLAFQLRVKADLLSRMDIMPVTQKDLNEAAEPIRQQQKQIDEMSKLCLTNAEVMEIKVEVIDSLILYLDEQPACNYEGNPTIEKINDYVQKIKEREQ